MKRKSHLYEDIYKLENIEKVFMEVCRNTKNKKRVEEYKELKCAHIYHIYELLKKDKYEPGKCNIFTIYEPKKRIIVSQKMDDYDKSNIGYFLFKWFRSLYKRKIEN